MCVNLEIVKCEGVTFAERSGYLRNVSQVDLSELCAQYHSAVESKQLHLKMSFEQHLTGNNNGNTKPRGGAAENRAGRNSAGRGVRARC